VFRRRSAAAGLTSPPHPGGVTEEAASPDQDPVVTEDAVEPAPREGATSADAAEGHNAEPFWLSPTGDLPTAMADKAWRKLQWEQAPDRFKLEWGSAVSNASKPVDPRYASPLECRWALENAKWRTATYRAELEMIDRRLAASQLALVREAAAGTHAAALAERLLHRLATPDEKPDESEAAAADQYGSVEDLVEAYEQAQSEIGHLRNEVGDRRQQEVELEALVASAPQVPIPRVPMFSEADAARSIQQLQVEFGDEALLRHRAPLAVAVRAGEPYAQLRQMVADLELEHSQRQPRDLSPETEPVLQAPAADDSDEAIKREIAAVGRVDVFGGLPA
jgi:hypothetical protein